MKYIIKIGQVYLSYISIENYDFDFRIDFNININNGKSFNLEECKIVKQIIDNLIGECTIIAKEEKGEENES